MDEDLLRSIRFKFPELSVKQVPYTVISYPTTVSDPNKLTNTDNNTGYGTGKAYAPSGHVEKILKMRRRVAVKRNGLNGVVYCPINSKANSPQKYADGLNTVDDMADTVAGIYEPKFYYKGVNDYVNRKNYMVWAWTEDGLPPAKPKVSILDYQMIQIYKTADKYIDPSMSTLDTAKKDSVLFDMYTLPIPTGAKKVRIQLPISNEPKTGLVFINDTNDIVGNFELKDTDNCMLLGMYTVLNIPNGATKIVTTVPKSLTTIKTLFSFTDNIIDVEDVWCLHDEQINTPGAGLSLRKRVTFPMRGSTFADYNSPVTGDSQRTFNIMLDPTNQDSYRYHETHYDAITTDDLGVIINLAYCKYGGFDLAMFIGPVSSSTQPRVQIPYWKMLVNDFNEDTVVNPGDLANLYVRDPDNMAQYSRVYRSSILGYESLLEKTSLTMVSKGMAKLNFPYNVTTSIGIVKHIVHETYMAHAPINKALDGTMSTYYATRGMATSGANENQRLGFQWARNTGVNETNPYYYMVIDSAVVNNRSIASYKGRMEVVYSSDEFISFPEDTTRYKYFVNGE